MAILSDYLHEIRTIHQTGAATPETAFYPPVSRLFNAVGEKLKPKVLFVTQLKNQGAGMPDGGFYAQPKRSASNVTPSLARDPDFGAVEIKPARWNLDELTRDEQTARYLKQYGAVLITNLREFRLLVRNADGTDENPRTLERYVLAETEDDLWYGKTDAKHTELLPDFLRRAMLYKVPLSEPKQVAWLLASYAREARARAEEHELPAFRNVKTALEESLGIQFEGEKGEHFFRSTLVQTLFYGIFSAWVLWRHSPEYKVPQPQFNWKLAEDYLKVPVLRKLFREVSDRRYLKTIELTEILDWAGEALNRVQLQLFDIFQGEEAVAYFYEPFLEAFDPQLRKELGVWYTPRQIVQYQVERVDHLLRTELGQELGLASNAVRILDPCCGTGAYLTAVLGRIHKTLLEEAGDDTALVPSNLRKAALTRVFGFEIMPAPFVIAHMEIARLLEDAGAPLLGEEQRAGIFLTNALTGWEPLERSKVMFLEMQEEREAADFVKQKETILVILGNPPYNGYAGIAKMDEERDLKVAYKKHIKGLPKPEGKGLNDLYIRFFRIAERKITGVGSLLSGHSGLGVVCFISNSSWLDGFSHPTMRHHVFNHFDQIQIDNLNGDKFRTGKKTPEGLSDPSVFTTESNKEGIQPGVAITTLLKTRTGGAQVVALRSLWGQGKLSQLSREAMGSLETPYSVVEPEKLLGLPYSKLRYTQEYLRWPLLSDLFASNYNGVQTSRDSLLVDLSSQPLMDRMERHLASDDRLPSFRPWQTLKYLYRPFDLRHVYWEKGATLLVRGREEYISGYFGTPSLVLPRQHRLSYAGPIMSASIVDINAVDGGSSIFVNSFASSKLLDGSVIHENWTAKTHSWLNGRGVDSASLTFHVLAVTHCPLYQEENMGALQRDWPRIPLPATGELLARSAGLGRRLAELLDAESAVKLGKEWSFLAALKVPAGEWKAEHLLLTAGWGSRGQGSTVMPGRGKVAARAWTAAEMGRLGALAAERGMTLDEALGLLGEQCVDVYLNGGSWWAGVPAKVWSYTLGGYQVLKKWLSYREGALLGRALRVEEAEYFQQVVRRIAAILLMGPALDASYRAILPGATGLAGRNADSLRE